MLKQLRIALKLELDWPYQRHTSVFVGVQRYARECKRWECVVDELAEGTLRNASKVRPYDGIIARATLRLAAQAKRWGIPLVNTWVNSPAIKLPSVAMDLAATGRMVADHFLHMGLRRVHCMSIRDNRGHALLMDGFHEKLQAAGLSCGCVSAMPSYATDVTTRQRFLDSLGPVIKSWKSPVGCYVMMDDLMPRLVAIEVRRCGLRIPNDVALVAGTSERSLCLNLEPSLTNVEYPFEEIGYQAAKLLDSLMDGSPPPRHPIGLSGMRLVARRSTDFTAVDDTHVSLALSFMVSRIHKRLNVVNVAKAVKLSRRTLERRFAATLGCTVAEEIRRLRLDLAKRCLVDSQLPLKAIARNAGYANEQRMSEVFRRSLGITPSDFRRQARPNE